MCSQGYVKPGIKLFPSGSNHQFSIYYKPTTGNKLFSR